ncbi:GntR family transcriptional regulator [Streptomyces sp. NPDC016566]|uniref:GntR family transcriptional regulator n=1 Tax=Streptomyces sp. NPDC016566 TaxID=3364967 RepID=UPI0036F6F4E7
MARSFIDRRSAHQKIAAALRRQITRGDLAPGVQLPSTPALMEQYGVAGTTVQKALLALKEEGLLVGHAGKGVFVQGSAQQTITPAAYLPPSPVGEQHRWITEADSRSQRGSIKLLKVEVVEPPHEIAAALKLGEEERALLREQILLLDDEPAELARSYYPLSLAEGTTMMEPRRIRGGTSTLLSDLGYPPREAMDEVSSEIPTEEEVVALELPKDMPVMLTFRVVYSDNDRPIEASLLTKAAHRYRVRYRQQIR